MKGIEILIPSWPDALNSAARAGAADLGKPCGSLDGVRLRFFSLRRASGDRLPKCHVSVWECVGLTIYIHKDGQVVVDVRAQEVRGTSLEALEHLVKCLKWASKAVGDVPTTNLETLPFVLMGICTALGIKRTIQYHGINVDDTYAPVREALQIIVGEWRRRWERLQ